MKKFYIIFSFLILISNLSFSQTPTMLQGFPKNLDNKRNYSATTTPLIVDLNRDGQKEIIVVTENSSTPLIPLCNLTVTKSNGDSFQNFPKVYNDTIFTTASGDVNQDGYLDIVMRANSRIYAIDRFGNNLPGFPITYSDQQINIFKGISLYDLDGDSKLEIIVTQNNQMCVFDNLGQIKPGWPKTFTGLMHLTPAIGDLDSDGKAEIIALTLKQIPAFPYLDSCFIRIYKHNGESFSNNWPMKLDSSYGFWEGSPSIYINKNNIDSTFIIIPSLKPMGTGGVNFRTCISKYGITGNIKNRIFQNIEYYGYGTLAIADVDQNGTLEFFGGAGAGVDNYLFSNELKIMTGWPHEGILTFYRNPLIGKVKSGNELQIVYGNYYAFDGVGRMLGLTKEGDNLPWSPLYTTGAVFNSALSDINNDGSTDIIVLSKLRDTTSYISVYSITGIPFTPENDPWPMYAHDRYRTNQYGFIPPDEVVGIFPISSNVPDKFSLYQNYPNPFNPNTTIKFDLTKSDYVSLKVFDISGREVSQLVSENLKAGSYQVPFNAGELSSGVYFYQLRTNASVITKKMSLVK